jgi:hypothetical protein
MDASTLILIGSGVPDTSATPVGNVVPYDEFERRRRERQAILEEVENDRNRIRSGS